MSTATFLPPRLVPGLESATFSQWDQDVNDRISTADVARTLEVAYGVRTRGGALLRNNCGLVVDYITFSRLKISDDGMVSKADYFAALGPIEGKDSWMNSIDKNRDLKSAGMITLSYTFFPAKGSPKPLAEIKDGTKPKL